MKRIVHKSLFNREKRQPHPTSVTSFINSRPVCCQRYMTDACLLVAWCHTMLIICTKCRIYITFQMKIFWPVSIQIISWVHLRFFISSCHLNLKCIRAAKAVRLAQLSMPANKGLSWEFLRRNNWKVCFNNKMNRIWKSHSTDYNCNLHTNFTAEFHKLSIDWKSFISSKFELPAVNHMVKFVHKFVFYSFNTSLTLYCLIFFFLSFFGTWPKIGSFRLPTPSRDAHRKFFDDSFLF